MKCVMDHIVLNVEDDETMIAFYSEVLQMPTERLAEYRGGTVPFPSVRLNPDTIIDLFPKRMWEQSARRGGGCENLNHFCITVTRAEWVELRSRLDSNGWRWKKVRFPAGARMGQELPSISEIRRTI